MNRDFIKTPAAGTLLGGREFISTSSSWVGIHERNRWFRGRWNQVFIPSFVPQKRCRKDGPSFNSRGIWALPHLRLGTYCKFTSFTILDGQKPPPTAEWPTTSRTGPKGISAYGHSRQQGPKSSKTARRKLIFLKQYVKKEEDWKTWERKPSHESRAFELIPIS